MGLKPRYKGLDPRNFLSKIAWEGGVYGAYHYGLKPSDSRDPRLAILWGEICGHLKFVDELVKEIEEDFGPIEE